MTPPRAWQALLRWSVRGKRAAEIVADLTEEFEQRAAEESPAEACRWYRRQTLGFVFERFRRRRPRQHLIATTDVWLAFRLTRKEPIAAITSILALASAIGLSVAAFTFARGFVFPELGLPDGDRLYQVRMHRSTPGSTEYSFPSEVQAWIKSARTMDAVGGFQFVTLPVQTADETPQPIDAARVTPATFSRLAPAPLLGRHLHDADTLPGAQPVIVIGESFWRSRLNADPLIVSRQLRVGGTAHDIVGVMPESWAFPVMERLWLPLSLAGTDAGHTSRLMAWAILSRDSTVEAAEAELTNLARSVARADQRDTIALSVLPYVDGFSEGAATPAAALILGLLLIFLCGVSLNVANLIVARSASRADELALRTALGASRRRIVAMLFVESLVISLTAAFAGVVAVNLGLDWAQSAMGTEGPFWLNLSLDLQVVLFAVMLAVTASALTGIVPALRVTNSQAVPGISGQARITPVALGRFASVLLSGQLAASLALLATAGLLVEGLLSYRTPPNPSDNGVVTAVLYRDAAMTGVDAEWGSRELYDLRLQIEDALRQVPGAQAVGVSVSLPRAHEDEATIELEGQEQRRARVQDVMAGPGFFDVLNIRPSMGRLIEPADALPGATPVAVVSERFVREVIDRQPPLGRKFRRSGGEKPGKWIEIVGVIADQNMNPGDRSSMGEMFVPLIGTNFMYASLRTPATLDVAAPALRTAIASVDPRIRVTDIQSLADVGWEARALLGGVSGGLALLGSLALLLSLAGVYALASLAVTSRTREIGVRMALGASSQQVLKPVLRRTAWQLGIGVASGVLLAVLLAQALGALPITVPMSIGLMVPASALLLILAGALASWLPARRAMRIDPVTALRAD